MTKAPKDPCLLPTTLSWLAKFTSFLSNLFFAFPKTFKASTYAPQGDRAACFLSLWGRADAAHRPAAARDRGHSAVSLLVTLCTAGFPRREHTAIRRFGSTPAMPPVPTRGHTLPGPGPMGTRVDSLSLRDHLGRFPRWSRRCTCLAARVLSRPVLSRELLAARGRTSAVLAGGARLSLWTCSVMWTAASFRRTSVGCLCSGICKVKSHAQFSLCQLLRYMEASPALR